MRLIEFQSKFPTNFHRQCTARTVGDGGDGIDGTPAIIARIGGVAAKARGSLESAEDKS